MLIALVVAVIVIHLFAFEDVAATVVVDIVGIVVCGARGLRAAFTLPCPSRPKTVVAAGRGALALLPRIAAWRTLAAFAAMGLAADVEGPCIEAHEHEHRRSKSFVSSQKTLKRTARGTMRHQGALFSATNKLCFTWDSHRPQAKLSALAEDTSTRAVKSAWVSRREACCMASVTADSAEQSASVRRGNVSAMEYLVQRKSKSKYDSRVQ